MLKIKVEAEIKSTEDAEKVKNAVLNIIETENVKIVEIAGRKILRAESNKIESLKKLHSLLRKERILDSARKMMKRWSTDERIMFFLNKQAAYMGHLSFCMPEGESPLGPIVVEIEGERLREIIDWLAPPTSRGKPIFEKKMPVI
ncbi:MAG TPA: hypothetical protein ENG81_03415 [Candidatus Bathyarchaeota archaeon]|nr:hypothetical protein [Candidatus Verstraetearchaeota archaeon]RLE57031.1 MAG: hypothetical protein DRJ30_01195 [Candidatus Verstraetearchaeota archaeon]HDO20550.1 hypothetical protein [Candidatus Bathyarchaeota archaeon]